MATEARESSVPAERETSLDGATKPPAASIGAYTVAYDNNNNSSHEPPSPLLVTETSKLLITGGSQDDERDEVVVSTSVQQASVGRIRSNSPTSYTVSPLVVDFFFTSPLVSYPNSLSLASYSNILAW